MYYLHCWTAPMCTFYHNLIIKHIWHQIYWQSFMATINRTGNVNHFTRAMFTMQLWCLIDFFSVFLMLLKIKQWKKKYTKGKFYCYQVMWTENGGGGGRHRRCYFITYYGANQQLQLMRRFFFCQSSNPVWNCMHL